MYHSKSDIKNIFKKFNCPDLYDEFMLQYEPTPNLYDLLTSELEKTIKTFINTENLKESHSMIR